MQEELTNLLQHVRSVMHVNTTEQIAHYLDRFAQLEELALSEDESVDFLDVLIEETSATVLPTNDAEKEAS